MLAALLKVINKKKQSNTSGHFFKLQTHNLLYCVKDCSLSMVIHFLNDDVDACQNVTNTKAEHEHKVLHQIPFCPCSNAF